MTLEKNLESLKKVPEFPIENGEKVERTKGKLTGGNSTIAERLEELESLPQRHAATHWIAFSLSLLSLILLSTWVFSSRGPVLIAWIILDIGLGVVFAAEFFTRSGFRWDRVGLSHGAFQVSN